MKPKIQIVNDNDEIIAHKDRSAVDYSVDIYRSSCLWLENSIGEVLLAQRKLTKDKDPGKWGPAVAGTIDEGETYASNIIKEAEEEIGLTDVDFSPVTKLREDKPRMQFIQVFRAIVDKPIQEFAPQEEEVEQVVWMPKEQLKADITNNPDKYVPAMSRLMELFQ